MKLNFKNVLFLVALFVFSFGLFGVSNVNAVTGQGTATLGGGASQTVEISSSTKFTVALTVGAAGIAVDAASPVFNIPSGFTAPHAAGGAPVPTNTGEVNVDGEWFAAGAGGTCAITMASSGASGQAISVDVTGACVSGNTITLTYQGSAPATAMAATAFPILTADTLANGAVVTIATPPTVIVKGTAVFANHAIAGVATTDNLSGRDQLLSTDKVLGGFKITAAGENVTVTNIYTTVALGSMVIGEFTNFRIVPDDGTGGGVANDGTMQAGELAAPLQTIASPSVGGNAFSSVSTTVTAGSSKNYFLVGTLAATVTDGDTVTVQAVGASSVSAGVTSSVAITPTGTTTNSAMTVTDTVVPTVVSVSPADTTLNVSPTSDIVIVFSKSMATGTFTFTTAFSNSVSTADVFTPVWSTTTLANDTVTLSHTGDFRGRGHAYTASIDVATDSRTNLNSVASLPYTWVFTPKGGTSPFTTTQTPTVADTTPPSSISVGINSGAASTSSLSVTLALTATDATQMIISNDAGFSGASWETYATSKSWTFMSGDGVKTVYAKFRDAAGNTSIVVSDTITTVSESLTVTQIPAIPAVPATPATPASEKLCPNSMTVASNCSVAPIVSTPAAKTYNFGTSTLKNGSKGDAVMELQRFLNEKLDLGLVIDGKLGPKTIAVIKKWQKANGLVADGLVGKATKAKMNSLVE